MGNYGINLFKEEVRQLIIDRKIDEDKDGIIESDKGELALLLSATETEVVNNLLNENFSLSYATNSDSNIFLKQYIEGMANKKGIVIPKGLNISVSSPSEYSEEFKALLRYVRTEIYGARVGDMFDLLIQDKEQVFARVQQMKIPDADKEKILVLKKIFDNYYKLQISYNGVTYNLLNLSDDEKKQLTNVSPEFLNFINEEKDNLKKNTTYFARKELERLELSEAAETSKNFVPTLLSILAASTAVGFGKTAWKNYQNKKDYVNFIKEQRILKHRKVGLQNPFKEIVSKIKNCKSKWMIPIALLGIIGSTAIGSADDVSGCYKDFKQDQDNFGEKRAKWIAGLSAFWGIATSFLIAPTIDVNSDINCARSIVKKDFLKRAKEAGQLDRAQKLMRLVGKRTKSARLMRAGRAGLVAGAVGVLIAASSSGSSWASMAGTRYLFAKNGDDLVDKNIIDEKDNTSEKSNDLMMEYEAYKGKWRGIAVGPTSDPVVGFTFGSLGLLSHANPYISTAFFSLQGCSETLTACAYQLTGDDSRGNKLEKEKEAFLASASAVEAEVA